MKHTILLILIFITAKSFGQKNDTAIISPLDTNELTSLNISRFKYDPSGGTIVNCIGYYIMSDIKKSKIVHSDIHGDCNTNFSKVHIVLQTTDYIQYGFLKDIRKGCEPHSHLEIKGDTTLLIMKLIDHYYDDMQEKAQEIKEREEMIKQSDTMIRLCVDYINSLNIDSKTQGRDKKFQAYQREIKKFGYRPVKIKI